jgi:hypothetical protein
MWRKNGANFFDFLFLCRLSPCLLTFSSSANSRHFPTLSVSTYPIMWSRRRHSPPPMTSSSSASYRPHVGGGGNLHHYNQKQYYTTRSRLLLSKKNCRRFLVCAFIYCLFSSFVFFKTWFPGDPTLRKISESSLKLMFSRSGFSFGTSFIQKRFKNANTVIKGTSSITKTDGAGALKNPSDNDFMIKQTRKQYVVQGHIPDRPTWGEDFNIQRYVKQSRLLSTSSSSHEEEGGSEEAIFKQLQCFFTAFVDEPKLVLYDNGRTHIIELGGGNIKININDLTCEHFRATTHTDGDRIEETWSVESEDEDVGKLAIVSSATNLEMLSEYHRTLLNHLEYAKSHGYANYLSLVNKRTLEGRSGKFAKHLAMGALISTGDFNTVCHVDLDAWFASWAPFSYYAKSWPRDKDLLFGDTDQIWLNSGLMVARSTPWSAHFFEKVMNSVHSVNAKNNDKIGYKRDQPAVWHVLADEWKEMNVVPSFKGTDCENWIQCNPDENPVECWHWCYWDAFQRIKNWDGLLSLNSLPNIYVVPTDLHPQMHRMCIRSCYSVAARAVMGVCSGLTRGYAKRICFPKNVDKMSLCDGKGCLKQMESNGGAWLKHTGHQHWRDVLPSCVPRNRNEAALEQKDPFALCAASY